MKYILFLSCLLVVACQSMQEVQQEPYFAKIQSSEDIFSGNYDEIKPILDRNNDTTYVINFWATWCKPCVEELPYFEGLYDQYRDQPVKFYLISLDFPSQINNQLFPFIKKHQLKSTVIHLNDPDANTWINAVDSSWSGAIPATLVYNEYDRTFYEQSFHSEEEIKEIIQPFLQ